MKSVVVALELFHFGEMKMTNNGACSRTDSNDESKIIMMMVRSRSGRLVMAIVLCVVVKQMSES